MICDLSVASDSTQQRSVWRWTTSTSGESSTETWSLTTCCWTLRDTSNSQTTACARCGFLVNKWTNGAALWIKASCRTPEVLVYLFHINNLFCFCRRVWDQAIQQALSVVPLITSLLKYSEERIMVRITRGRHLLETLSDDCPWKVTVELWWDLWNDAFSYNGGYWNWAGNLCVLCEMLQGKTRWKQIKQMWRHLGGKTNPEKSC